MSKSDWNALYDLDYEIQIVNCKILTKNAAPTDES